MYLNFDFQIFLIFFLEVDLHAVSAKTARTAPMNEVRSNRAKSVSEQNMATPIRRRIQSSIQPTSAKFDGESRSIRSNTTSVLPWITPLRRLVDENPMTPRRRRSEIIMTNSPSPLHNNTTISPSRRSSILYTFQRPNALATYDGIDFVPTSHMFCDNPTDSDLVNDLSLVLVTASSDVTDVSDVQPNIISSEENKEVSANGVAKDKSINNVNVGSAIEPDINAGGSSKARNYTSSLLNVFKKTFTPRQAVSTNLNLLQHPLHVVPPFPVSPNSSHPLSHLLILSKKSITNSNDPSDANETVNEQQLVTEANNTNSCADTKTFSDANDITAVSGIDTSTNRDSEVVTLAGSLLTEVDTIEDSIRGDSKDEQWGRACIRIVVNVSSRYRICDANPQDNLQSTWAEVVGQFQQVFFIRSGCGGRPVLSDRLVTVNIDKLRR